MWDKGASGKPKLITPCYLFITLGALRPRESSHLPRVTQLPGDTKRAARYTTVVKWLLKSASHKHFPSHCPDSSSADLNGDLWFFPFLITVQTFSRARFLWGPKWFPFSLNFFSPRIPCRVVSCFKALRWSRFLTLFSVFLRKAKGIQRIPPYNESPRPRFKNTEARSSDFIFCAGSPPAVAPPTSQVTGAPRGKEFVPIPRKRTRLS